MLFIRSGRRKVSGCALLAATIGFVLHTAPVLAADPATLTLYAAQHQQLIDLVNAAFTKETGIKVRVHKGEAPEIASQILKEGAHSPADIFFTENSPELTLLDERKLLAPVDHATLAAVPAADSAPSGNWLGVLARENVLAFNPAMITEDKLPASLLDLARPEWKGRVAIAPADADFLPLVRAVAVLKGKPAAVEWLRGLKRNAQVFDDDEAVVAAVERGAAATGVINNYYWARMTAEVGFEKAKSKIHHFIGGDVGALINISGAGILKSSPNQAAAQRYLAFIVSKPMQEVLGKSDIDFEYPLAAGVAAHPLLKPLDQLQPPSVSVSQLGDDREAAQMLRAAGLL